MGNSDSKEEIIIKCSLEEMVRHFFKDYVVVWHDPNVNSPENQQYIIQLKKFCDVLTFTEWEKALMSIQETKAACHVITSGTNGEVFVEKIFGSSCVVKIYIFCMNKEYHSTWAKKYQKVSCIETNIPNLINQIKQNLLEWYQQASSLKLNLPAFAPIFNDGDKSQMSHLHRYLKVISTFENRSQAKKDLLNLSKFIYTDPNNTKHIADFDKYYDEYNKAQILRWYTRESFLYKVTNNCLRIASADSIQYCRFLLKDLEQAVKDQYQAKSKHFNGLLYRGAFLSQEEWTGLKENQDREIEMHGFLSVSKEKNVALNFMKTDPSKKALITIIVPKGPNEEEQGFAEIEEYSFFPQEREILFNVRSRFTVIETEDEYSAELPYRHLVLLYGAQGLRKFTAEQSPVLKVPNSRLVKITCGYCTQGTSENFLFRPLDKQIYSCKNCIDKSNASVLLCTPLQNISTVPEINVKGCLLMNNSNQFNIPFYGYKCSQCQAKKQKQYFICTDCSSCEKKPTWWCENCFTETLNCIQAQHTILLETRPFSFWCERMSENELIHIKFQNHLISENNEGTFGQAEMYYASHNYDKAIEYYSLYLQRSKKKLRDTNRGAAFNRLGDAYSKKKEYEKALEYHLKSVEFTKSLFSGSDRDGLAASYGNVGSTYYHLKEYPKAIEYHSKALDIFKSLHQEKDVATAYCNIGVAYKCHGEYHQALENLFKALAIEKSQNGENTFSIAGYYHNIAIVFSNQGEFSKALEYSVKSLEIKKTLHGETHPSIATSYQGLAAILNDQGEYNKAIEYRFKALDIRKTVYGENSSHVADDYRKIGNFYKDWKEYTKALEYHLKSLDITKSLYGENHSDIALSYDAIGDVYLEQKEDIRALEYYLKSLEIKKLFYGENTSDIATSYENLGNAQNGQREYNKALEYHFKALNIKKTVYGENSLYVATDYHNIGKVYLEQKEYTKALEYSFKSLEIRKSVNGENRAEIALSYDAIGDVYLDQKEDTKALEYYSKSLEIQKSFSGENTGDIATSYDNLGKALNCQGEYNKALEYHFKALNIKKEVFGENRYQVGKTYSNIADVYMNQREHTKALEYALKSLEIDTLIYGKDRPGTTESQKRVLEIQSALS